MLIYQYSNTPTMAASGGEKSASTTLKYLKKYHNIKFFNDIKELKEKIIEEKPNLLLHNNIIDMIQIFNLCKEYNIPLIVTVNNLISCTSGTHIIQDDKFGKPYFKSNIYNSFLALYHEKYIRPFNEKLFAYITLPYRYWLKKKESKYLIT